jgi:RNA polymerase II subunit A C-terminal domain phosphatase SSU72
MSDRPAANLRVALVCLSNLNRSMEAHHLFLKNKYQPRSFGTGQKVKLPGESVNTPNVYAAPHKSVHPFFSLLNSMTTFFTNRYDFGTPYENIYQDLYKKNKHRYEKNGMLRMVDRDSKIKEAPERWHDEASTFELVISFDRMVFDAIIDDVTHRKRDRVGVLHVVNVETKDTHEEAANGAMAALDLMDRVHHTFPFQYLIIFSHVLNLFLPCCLRSIVVSTSGKTTFKHFWMK